MVIEVIGAGFGRTGTSSLKTALEQLGFGPCDHMGEVFMRPERALLWDDALTARELGEKIDWEPLHAGYTSTTDWPGAYFWRELVAAYPEAKVILTIRDPKRWYDSMERTVYRLSREPEVRRLLANRLAERFSQPVDTQWMPQLVDRVVWQGTFGGRFEEREHAIHVFDEHSAAVKAAIPADRLLVFDVREGWQPLCHFLGVAEPAEAFPHLNDGATIESILRDPPDDDLLGRMAAG